MAAPMSRPPFRDGFASSEEGDILTEEQQWAKPRGIVAIADRAWGTQA